jgi:hypothetical protein
VRACVRACVQVHCLVTDISGLAKVVHQEHHQVVLE